jgi:hypothetical protein
MKSIITLHAKLRRLCCALLTGLTLLPASQGQTSIQSVISSDQVWTAANSPYVLSANAVISQGVTVRVRPGVHIRTTGKFKIVVEGAFEASGTKDSVIRIDTATFEFTNNAKGYDFNARSGSHFSYCHYTGSGINTIYTITLSPISMLISNCRFENVYYTVYGMNANTDTCLLRIEKSVFLGGNSQGYAAYIFGSLAFLEMDECLVSKMYGFYFGNYATLTRNRFEYWMSNSGLRINTGTNNRGRIIISCNEFYSFRSHMIEIAGTPNTFPIIINNNTFDSTWGISGSAHIRIALYSRLKNSRIKIYGNNFLRGDRTILLGGGNAPGMTDTLDLRSNYYGGRTQSQIAASITDYSDDILIALTAWHGSGQSSKITDCLEADTSFDYRMQVSELRMQALAAKAYPNPANDKITLEYDSRGEVAIEIHNLAAQVVYSGTGAPGRQTIDCSRFIPGMYIATLRDAEGKTSQLKLLLQR